MNVSERIKTIVDEISHRTLADIGTDHGYIPIYAYKTAKIDSAIACDVNEIPLLNAKSNIFSYEINKYIQTRLGYGLIPIQAGESETCTIAGMGGDLIINILDCSKELVQNFSQLILQPQSKIENVRRYIHDIGFRIVNEEFIEEAGKYYTVINSIKGEKEKYTPTEYVLGKILIEKKVPIFIEYINKEKNKIEAVIKKIEKEENTGIEEKIAYLNSYIEIYKEVL